MRPAYRCHNVEENSKVGVKAKAETGTCGCPKAVCWVPAGGTGDPLVCLPMGDGHPVISPGIFHPFNPRGALAGAKLWERPCLGRICIPGPAGRAAAAPAAVALSSPCGPHERPLPSRGGPGWGGQGARAGGSQVPRGEWGAWEGRGAAPNTQPRSANLHDPHAYSPHTALPQSKRMPPPHCSPQVFPNSLPPPALPDTPTCSPTVCPPLHCLHMGPPTCCPPQLRWDVCTPQHHHPSVLSPSSHSPAVFWGLPAPLSHALGMLHSSPELLQPIFSWAADVP